MQTAMVVSAHLALALISTSVAHADRVKDHEQSCQDGDAVSCHLLGMIYEQGEGLARDVEAASQYYDSGCAGGFSFSCYRLGVLKATEQDPPYNREVLELLVASCAEWIAEGCFVAAESFLLMNEDKKAENLMLRACELGHPRACLIDFR
jgi:TPR repeat protein